MNLIQRVGYYTVAGGVVGAGLASAATLHITQKQQEQAALVGAVAGFAFGVIRPVLSRVKLSPVQATVVDVATQIVINVAAMKAFDSIVPFNAPAVALFAVISTMNIVGEYV